MARTPLGSLRVVGLSPPYVYPLSCCGSFFWRTGSVEMNLPVPESYWRAPISPRPVLPLAGLLRNPWLSGQLAPTPRGCPYGVLCRQVGFWAVLSRYSTGVWCWSLISNR